MEGDREQQETKTIVVSASEARLITPDQVTKSEERGRAKRGKLGKENEWRTRREIIIKTAAQEEIVAGAGAGGEYCTKGSAVQMAPQRDHIDFGFG